MLHFPQNPASALAISQVRPSSTPPNHFGVEGAQWGDVSVRTLGPVLLWHGVVSFRAANLARVKEAIVAASNRSGSPIRGYFTDNDGKGYYHTIRYARRLGESIPSPIGFHQQLEVVKAEIISFDPSSRIDTRQHLGHHNSIEATLGLREGYGDNQVRTYSLQDLRSRLTLKFTASAAEIFSCFPSSGVYQEPAAIIVGPTDGAEALLAAVASQFKQARFGVIVQGDLCEQAKHLTVEIMPAALASSAQARVEPSHSQYSLSQTEFMKILLGDDKPSIGFEKAYRDGKLSGHPELLALRGVPQDPTWHAEGDCWIHTMWVLDEAWELGKDKPYRPELVLGAICHDLGKALTTLISTDPKKLGRWIAIGHEDAGVVPAKALLSRLGIAEKEVAIALAITELHMLPRGLHGELTRGRMHVNSYEKAVRRVINKLPPGSIDPFLDACEADERGRGTTATQKKGPFAWKQAFADLAATIKEATPKKEPLIDGAGLASIGFPPGPKMGALLKEIAELRDQGSITIADEALALARSRLGTIDRG